MIVNTILLKMEQLSTTQVQNELKMYEAKLLKKRLQLFCFVLTGIIILFLMTTNEWLFPLLNWCLFFSLIFLIDPVKKIKNEISVLKLTILLLKFVLDENKEKKLDPQLVEILKN